MTEDEKAERWPGVERIKQALLRDSGMPLHPGDEKTPPAGEPNTLSRDRVMPLFGRPDPSTALGRILRDWQEHERQGNMAFYGTPNPGIIERAKLDRQMRWLIDPLADHPSLRNQVDAIGRRQAWEEVLDGSAMCAVRGRMDRLGQPHYSWGLAMGHNVVRRLTSGLDNNRIRPAIARHEPDTLGGLWGRIDSVAALRIADPGIGLKETRVRADAIAAAIALAHDATVTAVEAWRMRTINPPTIAELSRFLTEDCAPLKLLHTAGLSAPTHQRADWLARITWPAARAAGFDVYDLVSIERIQADGAAILRELKVDFGRDRNPIFVWEAFRIARCCELDLPEWVLDHLAERADGILSIREEVADGKPVGKEAVRVGKALGFGIDSPGQGGWFQHALVLQRDRKIHLAVSGKLETGTKLDFAYDEVAKVLDVSRSTIVRSYMRIKKLNGGAGKPDDGEDEVSRMGPFAKLK